MTAKNLITAEELSLQLQNPNVTPPILIEVVSPEDLQLHPLRLPNSHILWRPDFEAPAVDPLLGGLIPTLEQLTILTKRLGINEESRVVILDHKYDATRLWWILILFGKDPDTVAVLDGGYAAALEFGLATEREAIRGKVTRGDWMPRPPKRDLLASMEDVRAMKPPTVTDAYPASTSNETCTENTNLWDVRTEDEFHGRVTLKGASKPGRIPWTSGRIDWFLFRNHGIGNNTWKSPDEIRKLAASHLGLVWTDDEAVDDKDDERNDIHTFYCQSGVRTTQLIFGLVLAGFPLERLKNYDGSWVEWSYYDTNERV